MVYELVIDVIVGVSCIGAIAMAWWVYKNGMWLGARDELYSCSI